MGFDREVSAQYNTDGLDLSEQVGVLAQYIIDNIPGEPSRSEGAIATAIRVMTSMSDRMERARHELGVPSSGYPAPVVNAVELLTL